VVFLEAELGGRVSPYCDYEEPPGYGTPDEADDTLTIEIPREGFSETAMENLKRLVKSKETLIKKALGTDRLPIEQTGDKLRFPWFSGGLTAEEVNAYARFIGALYAMAKSKQRVTATEKPVDNEKYAFRCFLLRWALSGRNTKRSERFSSPN
jgi:hypothetical protein